MSEHLSVDALADLLAGEGDDGAVDHVAGCDSCSARLAELDAALVPLAAELAALAAAPLPAPPADLEERLLARLREAESADTSDGGDGAVSADVVAAAAGLAPATDVVPAPVVPLRPRAAGRPRGAGLLGAAAGAVGLLALVGLGLGAIGDGGTGDAAGAGGGAGSESATTALAPAPDVVTSATGNDYRPDSAGFRRVLPVLLDPGTPGGDTALDSASRSAGEPGAAAPPAATEQFDAPAGSTGGSTGGSGGGTSTGSTGSGTVAGPAPDPLARLRDPAELAGCLAALTGPDSDGVPLALDYATFEGRPALVVVLPSAREGSVDVFAVGEGCRAGDDQTLFFTRLPRP